MIDVQRDFPTKDLPCLYDYEWPRWKLEAGEDYEAVFGRLAPLLDAYSDVTAPPDPEPFWTILAGLLQPPATYKDGVLLLETVHQEETRNQIAAILKELEEGFGKLPTLEPEGALGQCPFCGCWAYNTEENNYITQSCEHLVATWSTPFGDSEDTFGIRFGVEGFRFDWIAQEAIPLCDHLSLLAKRIGREDLSDEEALQKWQEKLFAPGEPIPDWFVALEDWPGALPIDYPKVQSGLEPEEQALFEAAWKQDMPEEANRYPIWEGFNNYWYGLLYSIQQAQTDSIDRPSAPGMGYSDHTLWAKDSDADFVQPYQQLLQEQNEQIRACLARLESLQAPDQDDAPEEEEDEELPEDYDDSLGTAHEDGVLVAYNIQTDENGTTTFMWKGDGEYYELHSVRVPYCPYPCLDDPFYEWILGGSYEDRFCRHMVAAYGEGVDINHLIEELDIPELPAEMLEQSWTREQVEAALGIPVSIEGDLLTGQALDNWISDLFNDMDELMKHVDGISTDTYYSGCDSWTLGGNGGTVYYAEDVEGAKARIEELSERISEGVERLCQV